MPTKTKNEIIIIIIIWTILKIDEGVSQTYEPKNEKIDDDA